MWKKKKASNSNCISSPSLILLLVSAQLIVATCLNVCLEGSNVLAQKRPCHRASLQLEISGPGLS